MTKNKNAERKGFQAFSQRWLNNKPPMVRPSRPIKFVPTVPNFPGPWLTCLQMDPEMNLGSFYKCSYTWNFYGVCMIVSVWLFQILKASKYSLSGSFLVWDSDSLSSWNENGSTLLRDWLRRRPTLNDMVRHHFFIITSHTALKRSKNGALDKRPWSLQRIWRDAMKNHHDLQTQSFNKLS